MGVVDTADCGSIITTKEHSAPYFEHYASYLPCGLTTNHDNVSAGKTDESVDILNNNSEGAEDAGCRGRTSRLDVLAANSCRGIGAASGCGSRKGGESKGDDSVELHFW
jgi:hypothetical protein